MNCFSSTGPTAPSAAIWDIVIAKYGRQPSHYDAVVLAGACELCTGAEIEGVFCDALYQAFAAGREPKPADMLEAMHRTVPLAQLMDNQIAALRQWARGRARVAGADRTGGRCNGRRVQAKAS